MSENGAILTGGATEPFNGQWYFSEAGTEVGRVQSCCMYCAWGMGHSKWPEAEMGHDAMDYPYDLASIMIRGECSRTYWTEERRRGKMN